MKKHYTYKQRKIHKLKRKNVVFGQQRMQLLQTLVSLKFQGNLGVVKIVTISDKIMNISEQIGKNSAKIQRLRTLISQEKCNG